MASEGGAGSLPSDIDLIFFTLMRIEEKIDDVLFLLGEEDEEADEGP